MLLYQLLRFGESLRLETMVRVEFHGWFDPELGLTIGVLHMYMRPRLLAREEVEPKPLDAQDRRTHMSRRRLRPPWPTAFYISPHLSCTVQHLFEFRLRYSYRLEGISGLRSHLLDSSAAPQRAGDRAFDNATL